MKVLTGLSGWLCLSALLSSVRTGEAQDSFAKCSLNFSAKGSSESVRLAAEAVADASAYVCGDGSVAQASATAIAEVTAKAAARAVAKASAKCYSDGNASFKVNGRSLAEAHAYAYAQAYAAGFVDAQVCDKCHASAEFVAESFSELFLSAVADAELNLEGSGTASVNAEVFVEAVAEAVVTAYAKVLVDARAAVDKGCDGSIIGVVITGDKDGPKDGAKCEITVAGRDVSIAKDAVAKAAIEISDIMCGDNNRRVDAVSKKYAAAVAIAIARVTLDCEVFGNAYACALGEAGVKSVAKATAKAIAEVIVESNLLDTDCNCDVTVHGLLEATETLIANAAAEAYAVECPEGTGVSFNVKALEVSIEAKFARAFAGIWLKILDDGCTVDIPKIVTSVKTKTCKTCTRFFGKCYYGDHRDTKGCCDPKYKCVKRSSSSGYCIDPTKKPRFWAGGILQCTEDN